MTKRELDDLIKRTEEAIRKTERLLNDAKQKVSEEEMQVSSEEQKAKRDGLFKKVTGGNLFLSRDEAKHRKRMEEFSRDINQLKDRIIPRLEEERSKLNYGLGELKKMQPIIDDLLRRGDSWRSSLDSIIRAVESEHL